MKRRLIFAGGVCAACTVIGAWITFILADIPFGTMFSIALNMTLLFLTLSFLAVAFALFFSRRSWIRWTATLPLAVGVLILVVGIAIETDPRVLHYHGLPPSLTPEEWQKDGQFLVNAMVDNHADLFALIDSARWVAVTDSILNRIPTLQEPAILMEFTRLVGLPRDGHTFPFIMAPCFNIHSFPITLYGFPEGWYVVRAARGLTQLEGSKLLAISGRPIDEIFETYPQLIAWENEQSRKEHFTYMVVMAEWLAYHGLIGDTEEAQFTFLTADGDTVSQILSSVPFWPYFLWSSVFPVENNHPPVLTAPREDAYTWRMLEQGKVLYIQFNQCVEPPDKPKVAEFAREIGDFLHVHPVERCIIDLRNNDGGGRIYGELLKVIRDDPSINRRGGLFVLIGRRTFSAAVRFATELQLQTHALFVGEATGQGPTFYSRPRPIELPHSGLLFAISSHHTISGLPFDNRKTIVPDKFVPYGIEDFRLGRDPVLTTAMSYEVPSDTLRTRLSSADRPIEGRYHHNLSLVMDVVASGELLQATVTDGLPDSPVRFTTTLHNIQPARYTTRLPGVTLGFMRRGTHSSSEAIVDWMGTSVSFVRANDGFELPFERFEKGDIEGGCSLLRDGADRYRTIYPELEQLLNTLGYQYLRGGRTKDALQVFGLNINLFPSSSNVYDSYGEALMVDDQIDSSIVNYRRSLELNPENRNAERVIQRLLELKQQKK